MSNRSKVWDYFTKIKKDKLKRNVCSALMTYNLKASSTSNLTRHLKVYHITVKWNEDCQKKKSTMNLNVENDYERAIEADVENISKSTQNQIEELFQNNQFC